jgi:alcohol dehydrogenase class IV
MIAARLKRRGSPALSRRIDTVLPQLFEFQVRPRILYGPRSVHEVGFEARKLRAAQAVLVTDQGLVRAGLTGRIEAGLAGSGVTLSGIYDAVPPNSEVRFVDEGAAYARAAGCDVLIALGGGSVLDTAKGMNLLLTEGGALLDYEGAGLLTRPLRPLIAIPTTAGTGSEVTIAAVIRDEAQGLKLEFNSPFLMPDVAILDPELTFSLPPGLTASTGMDALTHAIESYLSTGTQPLSDALAIGAIKLIAANLHRAVQHGSDLEARSSMLLASNMAGIAFSNALLGIVHAMAHPCGGRFGIPHGVANSILLPYGMEYNLPACSARLADLAVALGVDRHGMDDEAAARAGIAAVRRLARDCGLASRLSEVGVPHDGLAQLAADSQGDAMMFTNPLYAGEEDVLALYERAF